MHRLILTLALTAGVIVGGLFIWQIMKASSSEPPVAQRAELEVSVETIDAKITTHQPRISIIGEIEAKDEAVLTSPLETEVLAVLADEGVEVALNQSLVKLDTRETSLQLEAQLASLDDLGAQLSSIDLNLRAERLRLHEIRKLRQLAAEELDRSTELLERGVVSQAVVDQATAAASARELEIIGQQQKIEGLLTSRERLHASERGIEAQIGLLRLTLERAQILAPFDGMVRSSNTSAGTRVGRGTSLVTLFDPSSLRLRAAIPNEYASFALSGDLKGELKVNGVPTLIDLDSVAPEAKAGRGSIDALFTLPENTWLLGIAVEFDLLLPASAQSVALPYDALYSGSRIYVVSDESRAQAVDCDSNGQTVIDGQTLALLRCPGLAEGDSVVVTRIANLVSGTKLKQSRS